MIWASREILTPCFEASNSTSSTNPDSVTVVAELKKVTQKEEKITETIDSWEITVPTSMQILQNKDYEKIKKNG